MAFQIATWDPHAYFYNAAAFFAIFLFLDAFVSFIFIIKFKTVIHMTRLSMRYFAKFA